MPSARSTRRPMRAVIERLEILRERNQGVIDEIENGAHPKLEETRSRRVSGPREEALCRSGARWSAKQISLEQLSDIYAFRIVVDKVEDCYRALGVVHTTWHAVPGRFKDYISTPKQNDYQSIHTTIVGPRHQRVELQIRTERDAFGRRIRRGRARALQGRNGANGKRRGALAGLQRLSLAAPSGRHAARWRQPRGVPRAHQARAVPGSGVLLHAQGPADRAAARREPRSTSPMRCTPTSATPASAPRSTAGPCR